MNTTPGTTDTQTSELQKFKLFYEHIDDSRPEKPGTKSKTSK